MPPTPTHPVRLLVQVEHCAGALLVQVHVRLVKGLRDGWRSVGG